MKLPGKSDTFKLVVRNGFTGKHIVVGEYVNLVDARKALKEEKRKWNSWIFLVELAIPPSREREYEEEQRKLAKSRKPSRSAKSSKSPRKGIFEIYFTPDLHENKVEPERPSRAAKKGRGRGSS